jgi:hypothetical protein
MSMPSGPVRAALIGALAVGLLHMLLRFLVRHWMDLLVLWGALWLLGQCSTGSVSRRSEPDASFPAHKVTLSRVVANRAPNSRWVDSISATVANASPARLYDLRLRCEFHVTDDPERRSRVTTYYHFGDLRPGTSERITLEFELDGYLSTADPASFSCVPWFEYEQADLFRAASQSERDLRAQVDVTLSSSTEPSRVRHDLVAVRVEGQITNGASWGVASIMVACRAMKDRYGNTQVITRTLAVAAEPGETAAFAGQIGEVQPLDPTQGLLGHHCRVSGIRRSSV